MSQGPQRLAIHEEQDLVLVRQAVRSVAQSLGFSLVSQTKVVTAASELARNALVHGGGGSFEVSALEASDGRKGIQLVAEDKGPGIPDIGRAVTEGYTTGSGLGLGLSGSKRLMSEMRIETEKDRGTRVVAVRWK